MSLLYLPNEILEKISQDNLITKHNLSLILDLDFLKIDFNYENKFKYQCQLINYEPNTDDLDFWKSIDKFEDTIYCWHKYIPTPLYISQIPSLENIKIELVLYERNYTLDKKLGVIIKISNKNQISSEGIWTHSIVGLSTDKKNWYLF